MLHQQQHSTPRFGKEGGSCSWHNYVFTAAQSRISGRLVLVFLLPYSSRMSLSFPSLSPGERKEGYCRRNLVAVLCTKAGGIVRGTPYEGCLQSTAMRSANDLLTPARPCHPPPLCPCVLLSSFALTHPPPRTRIQPRNQALDRDRNRGARMVGPSTTAAKGPAVRARETKLRSVCT